MSTNYDKYLQQHPEDEVKATEGPLRRALEVIANLPPSGAFVAKTEFALANDERPSQAAAEMLRAAVAQVVDAMATLDQEDPLERRAWNSLERTRRKLARWADTLYLRPADREGR